MAYILCMKQIIEEARRVLMIDEGEPQDFLKNCVARLTEEIEFLVYYGINSKGMNPPRSPHLSKCLSYSTILDNDNIETLLYYIDFLVNGVKYHSFLAQIVVLF